MNKKLRTLQLVVNIKVEKFFKCSVSLRSVSVYLEISLQGFFHKFHKSLFLELEISLEMPSRIPSDLSHAIFLVPFLDSFWNFFRGFFRMLTSIFFFQEVFPGFFLENFAGFLSFDRFFIEFFMGVLQSFFHSPSWDFNAVPSASSL